MKSIPEDLRNDDEPEDSRAQNAIWVLTGEDREVFVNALLNPPEPSERMKAVAANYMKRVKHSS